MKEYYNQTELLLELRSMGIKIGLGAFKILKSEGMPRIDFGKRSSYHLATVLKWMQDRDGLKRDLVQSAIDKIARRAA